METTATQHLTTSVRCPDCGHEGVGRYCSACGMDTARGRLTVRAALNDVLGSMIDVDRPFWRTLGEFLIRPGEVSRAYVGGRRRSLASPFRVFVVGATLATLMQLVLLQLTSPAVGTQAVQPVASREAAIRAEMNEFLTANTHLLNIAIVPVLAVAYVPLFKGSSGFNVAEQGVGVFYTYGVMFLANGVLAPWLVLTRSVPIQTLAFVLFTAYAIAVAVRFNRDRWLAGTIKGVMGHGAMYATVLGVSYLLLNVVPKVIAAIA